MLRILRDRRGWVFIDALIGMVIVALALTALAMAYYQSTFASASANNRLRAVYIAQATLEDLKKFDRRDFASNPVVIPAAQQVQMQGSPVQFTVQVTQVAVAAIAGLSPRLVPVQVAVTWQEHNGTAGQVQMTGYYYQLEQ
ncbi:hypothetical protein [Anaeroselena agilis]|uniref:Uncharacterized protein n=1 Tax=Anaeroselena agilis TaxID=3063788 RepID=A0ABU3NYL4_9FIRM|nr:hypothetical protein [Selenomonadales bacterium 4137-cl]